MPKVPSTKSASKTTKSAAVKKTAVKKVAAKKAVTVPAVKKTAAKKAVASKTTVPSTAAPKKAARKSAVVKKTPIVTTVIAKIDAGFGNELFIRGSSSGLTWDSGALMSNTGSDEWVWKSTSVTSELEFKVLINDEIWSGGPNGVVFQGATVVFEPSF